MTDRRIKCPWCGDGPMISYLLKPIAKEPDPTKNMCWRCSNCGYQEAVTMEQARPWLFTEEGR